MSVTVQNLLAANTGVRTALNSYVADGNGEVVVSDIDDLPIFFSLGFQLLGGPSEVTSVNTRTGAVTLTEADVGIQSGTTTLVSGTKSISATLTVYSRILLGVIDAHPGAGSLTVGYSTPAASRDVMAGTFAIQADVAAGTINTLDVSTIDWLVIG